MAITKVQDIGTRLTLGGSTSKTITISAPAAGSLLMLMITHYGSNSVTSVSGGGVTWTKVSNVTTSDSVYTAELWTGPNSSGSGTTITIVVSNTYDPYQTNFAEWSGLDTAPVADPSPSTNTGTSATTSTSSVTPTAGKDVLLVACGVSTNDLANTPSGSFSALAASATALGGLGNGNSVFAYRLVTGASGSYSTSWTGSVGYRTWSTIIAGWDAAAGGGGATSSHPRPGLSIPPAILCM